MFPVCWKKSIIFPSLKKGKQAWHIELPWCIFTECRIQSLRNVGEHRVISISEDIYPTRPTWILCWNLVQFTSLCLKSIKLGIQVDSVYTDLESAFDMANHRILLAKFDRFGVSTNFVRLMESYLIGRQVIVKLGATESDNFGVPQGSNLGPLLFFLFSNNVCFVMPQSLYRCFQNLFAR